VSVTVSRSRRKRIRRPLLFASRSRRSYRFDCPRASFLTFFFCDPRGVVRFALGAAFLRAARFTFLRSAVSVIDFVFAIDPLCSFFSAVGRNSSGMKRHGFSRAASNAICDRLEPLRDDFPVLAELLSQPLQLREFLHQLFHSES